MKKWMHIISICAFSLIMLAGCSLAEFRQEEIPSDVASEETGGVQEQLPQEETELMKYERKYASGEFIMEDYQALAALYGEQGSIRKQRDMLEQSYRLYEDNEAFKLLQDISVNLEEEAAQVRAQAMLLYQNLETPEYRQEAIHVIESREWFDTMMPKLGEGIRKYFLQGDEGTQFLICVGYDENGKSFSNVWYSGNGGAQLTLLNYSGGVVQVLETSLKEEKYEGNFTLWVLDSISGSILKEEGTFENGIYSGEYTLKIHRNDAAGDPFDLWNNRENMEYTSYTVKADEQGQGDLEQFAAKLMSYPAVKFYEVKDETKSSSETASQPDAVQSQVRIFDGDIQVFQDGIWINMGSVEQYMEKDPFRTYVRQNVQEDKELSEENEGIDLDNLKLPADTKDKDKDKDKSDTTSKTPAKKPAAQAPTPQAPAVTPAPAAPDPAPAAPDDDDDDDDDDDGGSDNSSGSDSSDSSSDDGSSDNGSDNGGGDSGDNSGGGAETDVEWTPDLM